jgi:hypothetical protein
VYYSIFKNIVTKEKEIWPIIESRKNCLFLRIESASCDQQPTVPIGVNRCKNRDHDSKLYHKGHAVEGSHNGGFFREQQSSIVVT